MSDAAQALRGARHTGAAAPARRGLIALLLCAPLVGCATGGPEPGRYGAVEAGGEAIPAALAPQTGCERVLTGGALELQDSSRFVLSLDIHSTCADYSAADHLTYQGRYRWQGRHLEFTGDAGEPVFSGEWTEQQLRATPLGLDLLFRQGATGSTSIEDLVLARIDSQLAEHDVREDRYDCRQDAMLARAPAVAAADTAGIGGEVARHFPGWRLSTEREIACRFPLSDGSRPEMFWPEWGTGRAWWIWPGDFDGDGRQDRLVLLSSRTNPARDLLVALFANGQAAEVTSPGGWGVEPGPRRGEVVEGLDPEDEPVVLSADAVVVVYWEKAAELFHWQNGRFVGRSVGD